MVQGGHKKMCYYDVTVGCKSCNVIYGIWCEICQEVIYVGETGGPIYARVQNHLSSIRSTNPPVDLPVRRHFLEPGHTIDDLRVVGLERVWRSEVDYRRAREMRWMRLLGTANAVGGLNVRSG